MNLTPAFRPTTPASKFPGLGLLAGLCLVLAGVTLAVYWPVVQCDFVNYDDPVYFTANKRVLSGWNLENFVWAFTTTHTGNWHPLTWLSLMTDVDLFGAGPSGPHLTNLALHCANAVLLFLVMWRLTRTQWPSLLVAALFALHPLHVESVAWVSERKDLLSACFFMLSLLAYAGYAARATQPSTALTAESNPQPSSAPHTRSTWVYYALALGCFALGLMCKPMLVTLPFVLLLLDWWPLERIRGPLSRPALFRLVWEKWPFLLLSAVSCVVTLRVQQHGGNVVLLESINLTQRVQNTFLAYARYLGKTLWPSPLAMPYPYPSHWDPMLVLYGAALVVGLCALAVLWARRLPSVFTGWAWFVGTLIPVIGLVQVGDQSLADRYTYLPLIGLFIAVVWGVRAGLAKWGLPGWVAGLLAVGLLGACGLQTRHQIGYWQNTGTLFRHTVAVTEANYPAYQNLGVWLADHGQPKEALECFRHMLQMQPRRLDQLYNLGNACARVGGWPEAIECYWRAFAQAPRRIDLLNNLGFALTYNNQAEEAVECFEAVLKLEPNSPSAHNNLAAALLRQHRLDDAIRHYREALRLAPDNASIYANLGDALLKQGQRAEAAQMFQTALRLNPGDPQVTAKLRALEAPAAN